eukprot:gene12303-5977_t
MSESLIKVEKDVQSLENKIEIAFNRIKEIKKERENIKLNKQNQNQNQNHQVLEFTSGDTETTKKLRKYCLNQNLYSVCFKQVPKNYYDTPLEERRKSLNASSIHHLCKSMIIENSQCREKGIENKMNSQFYCVVLQYTSKLNSNKIMNYLREINQGKISKSQYSIQLADLGLSEKMTGFKRNAVTPIASKTKIPVILDNRILNLKPEYIWLGAGEVDWKIEISIQEFIKEFDPLIGEVTDLLEEYH